MPHFQPEARTYKQIQKGEKDLEKCRQKKEERAARREEVLDGRLKRTLE